MNILSKNPLILLISAIFIALLSLSPLQAQDQSENAAQETDEDVIDLDELLEMVRQGINTQTQEFKAREAEFLAARNRQSQLLSQARQTQASEERRSVRLEAQAEANEQRIGVLTTQLRDKLGNLSEVFGVLQQVAGDTRSVFQVSHISLEFPGREEGLTALINKAAEGTDLPTIEEIESLWYEMQREMTESSKISTFTLEVGTPDGGTEIISLTRIGDFNIIGNGKYYRLDENGHVEELAKQPPGRFTSTIDDLLEASPGEIVSFGIDPSRGQLLGIYVQTPSLLDRVQQGGLIGYLTLIMGAIGMLFIIERFVTLFLVGGKVRRQIKNSDPDSNNPLGRVLQVYHDNKNVDVETLELKLDEAILRETPALERFLTLIKLISAVAPLLGLLGTVTGMIVTFQAITLFGTGDPKIMAGGISQALVTTVLGLVVAIPTLLFHSIVAGMSKGVVHVLEEQSAGIIAKHAEQGG